MLLALLALALVTVVLGAPIAYRRATAWRLERARRRPVHAGEVELGLYDPGRERRAEQRARELLRSCVNAEEWGMYRDLGFIRVAGRHARRGLDRDRGQRPAYAYLLYPHQPRGPRAVPRRAPAPGLRLPRLPAQADRGLRAGERPAALRVLRRVPGP